MSSLARRALSFLDRHLTSGSNSVMVVTHNMSWSVDSWNRCSFEGVYSAFYCSSASVEKVIQDGLAGVCGAIAFVDSSSCYILRRCLGTCGSSLGQAH